MRCSFLKFKDLPLSLLSFNMAGPLYFCHHLMPTRQIYNEMLVLLYSTDKYAAHLPPINDRARGDGAMRYF